MKPKTKLISLIVLLALSLVILAACAVDEVTVEATQIPTATVISSTTPELTGDQEEATGEGETENVVGVVASRTPQPTTTPGPINQAVSNVAETTGLDHVALFGLTGEDWVNLAISIIIILLVGYVLATWIVREVLRWLVRRTPTDFYDRFLEATNRELRWLVTLITAEYATKRLQFLSVGLKTTLNDIYFILFVTFIFMILWKLIDFTIEWYMGTRDGVVDAEKAKTIKALVKRTGQIVLVLGYAMILLDHFGIDFTVAVAALGIGGLALSLAAKDTLADAISGIVIMIDQPFRIGDRIEIQGLGTWGDVVDVGIRTTKIHTRDNRLVIVPNSTIGNNQVVNYTYPDPQYRVQMDIGISYGQDIEEVRRIIVTTLRNVDGILPDRPVDALYIEMGNSTMIFRVRWWIESYEDTRRVYDRVNTALQQAMDEAGIETAYHTFDINVKLGPEELDRLAGSSKGSSGN
jgi:small-conductance mechanosensitive channel